MCGPVTALRLAQDMIFIQKKSPRRVPGGVCTDSRLSCTAFSSRSPFTHKTPLWPQTHRRLKTNMGSRAETAVTSKRHEWRKSRLVREFGVGDELDPSRVFQ
jgi:hypothetical protein